MKKSILNLEGASELTKSEKKIINGGLRTLCDQGEYWTQECGCIPKHLICKNNPGDTRDQ